MKIFITILFLLVLVEYISIYVNEERRCEGKSPTICSFTWNTEYVCIEEDGKPCYTLHYCEYESEDCSKAYISENDKKKYVCEYNPNEKKCHKIEICPEVENNIISNEDCLKYPVYKSGIKKDNYICVSKPEGG